MEANDECGALGLEGVQQILWVNGLIAQQVADNRVRRGQIGTLRWMRRRSRSGTAQCAFRFCSRTIP